MKYDHPDYHWDNDFPEDVSEDNAMTHMGIFFACALSRSLISDFHREEEDSAEPLKRVANRKLSPRDYVIQFCDSQFTNEDFTESGNAFADHYYIKYFFDDYCKIFEGAFETIYHVDDTWENADTMFPVLDKRFEEWKDRRDRKPWWKFW
jgi:hypothetical protein